NNSPDDQWPVAMQLAIFLNHAGHYGNVILVEDVRQWAGVSIASHEKHSVFFMNKHVIYSKIYLDEKLDPKQCIFTSKSLIKNQKLLWMQYSEYDYMQEPASA
ncbi:hypothetical protein PISMIDRAFT_100725, partial [Pisolithus microcarpus 441]